MKKIYLILLLILIISPAFATTLEEITDSKSPAYRVGTSNDSDMAIWNHYGI